MRWMHKWFSLFLGLLLILWALSGILLNHRQLISRFSVNRMWLPKAYHLKNWNNASIRSAIQLDSNKLFIYGNIGIWETDSMFQNFTSKMEGFPKGMDNVRTMRMVQTRNKTIFAATQSGLYVLKKRLKQWKQIPLETHDPRLSDMVLKNDSLWVLDRSHVYLFASPDDSDTFTQITIPPADDEDGKAGLFRTLWVLHSGELWGFAGKLLVDILAIVLILLSLTGYIYFFFPKLIRKLKQQQPAKRRLGKTVRFSAQWHNRLGVWLGAFLLVNVITGMFLRPPLLIAIAQARVAKIPFTILNDPNPWSDRLRNIVWNTTEGKWMIGTNDGIYLADKDFNGKPRRMNQLPPISVMGINVFEAAGAETYLIGSFNGLFLWNPHTGYVVDYLTGNEPAPISTAGSPIGEYLISGMVHTGSMNYIFDYDKGLLNAGVPMPELLRHSPLPLWNVALELHTARIFQGILGPFYILVIPLLGMLTTLIFISGFVMWYRKRKKKRRIPEVG